MTEPTPLAAEKRMNAPEDHARAVSQALAVKDIGRACAIVLDLHAADAADVISQVHEAARTKLIEGLRDTLDADVLAELETGIREEVLEQLGHGHIADAVVRLETDDAIGLLENLDDDVRAQVLDAVPEVERAHFESGLGYPEDSAGRLMQRDFIGIPEFWTVGQAIDFMRDSEDLPEDFYELFVVDPAQRPVGTLPLNRFIRTPRDGVIGSIMDRNPHLIPVDMDQEDAAFEFQQYDLMSAGVVGTSGRLLGVIMIDDIVDVINEEVEEDLLRLGGVAETDLARSVLTTTRRRFSWLFVNLLTAIFASFVIFMFEATIEEIVAVAILMPIVASMAGNAGTQSLTVAVRALATHDLTAANAIRIVFKELLVGFANGVLFAVMVAVVGGVWFDMPELGLVVGLATLFSMTVGTVAGIVVPLGLNKSGIDPAIASSVFVTTVTDVAGFFSFLGLVALLLL
jgi:magnesium transporter